MTDWDKKKKTLCDESLQHFSAVVDVVALIDCCYQWQTNLWSCPCWYNLTRFFQLSLSVRKMPCSNSPKAACPVRTSTCLLCFHSDRAINKIYVNRILIVLQQWLDKALRVRRLVTDPESVDICLDGALSMAYGHLSRLKNCTIIMGPCCSYLKK